MAVLWAWTSAETMADLLAMKKVEEKVDLLVLELVVMMDSLLVSR